LAQGRSVIAGAIHAVTLARPLNRFVTIHWEAGGLGGSLPTTRFLKLAGDWLALRSVPRVWLWVRESGDGKGDHVHILMHVPAHLGRAFAGQQRRWLKACGSVYRTGVIKTRAIGHSYATPQPGSELARTYGPNLRTAVEYLLKGADAAAAKTLGLTRSREFEGTITGKRTATSQGIGPAARARWNRDHPDRRAADGSRVEQIGALAAVLDGPVIGA
jgi:hypothetical protein